MADDAATRFYRASHAEHVARNGGTADYALANIISPAHRYFSAYREIIATEPDRVLELGYGTVGTVRAVAALGSFSYEIADIVDRSEGTEVPPNVRTHVCNLDNDFPFVSETYDLVIALMVVEHLYDPFHAVSEIARVLRRGGRLVMNLPNIASLKCRLQLLAGRMPVTSSSDWFEKREWDGNHLHYFTVSDVKRLARLYGLELLEMVPVGRAQAIKRLNPALFCHEITFVFAKS